MAIVDPVSDDRRTMLATLAIKMDRFSTVIPSELDRNLYRPPVKRRTERITGPLTNRSAKLDEVDYALRDDDNDEDEEGEERDTSETGALEELPARTRWANIANTKQSS